MKFCKEKEQSIIDDYKAGLNTVEIAKKWGAYNTSIRRVLLRYNIVPRTPKEAQSRVKVNPFKLGDEYSEYFLGLLLTDGSICHRKECNSVVISLSLKDKEMVECFRDFVCPKNKVSKVLQKKFNAYIFTVSVRSDLIANWLEKHGNFCNKSYECDIYTPMTPHILRGIFDGDGYSMKRNKGNSFCYGICGKSKIFLEKIQQYLLEQEISFTLYSRNNLYYLESTKTISIVKFYNLIYTDAHIYLKRKYDKGHLFMETLREKCTKFKEGDASSNPEPSLNNCHKLYNKSDGRYVMEGAETIMCYLNVH